MGLLFLLIVLWFVFVYHKYGRVLERLFELDGRGLTPAKRINDGKDYVPTRWPIVLGHHFASIAGAAPVIGPVLAASIWGWGPVLLWIVLGSSILGSFHDFASMALSLKMNGITIGNLAKDIVSKKAQWFLLVFFLLTTILVVAVFALYASKTLIAAPQSVVPSFGLIAVAIGVGFFMYRMRTAPLWPTIIGLAILAGLLVVGQYAPVALPVKNPLNVWIIIFLSYSFLASIMPVQYLLQPRDFLSSFLLVFGVIAGAIGLLSHWQRPSMELFSSFGRFGGNHSLWPMLFVTVACGAISGFHSLIASGTTVRQVADEKDCRKVSMGGMLLEGILAVIALFSICAYYPNAGQLAEAIKADGPIAAFAKGFGALTNGFLGSWGGSFAVIMLNTFILTTLDTATRIGCFLVEELFPVKNRAVSGLIVLGGAYLLLVKNSWGLLWPMFGATNQLIAAVVFLVVLCWAFRKKKPHKLFIFFAFLFMMLTTATALIITAITENAGQQKAVAMTIAAAILFMIIVLLYEGIKVVRNENRLQKTAE